MATETSKFAKAKIRRSVAFRTGGVGPTKKLAPIREKLNKAKLSDFSLC